MTSIKKPLDILKKEGNKAATEVALMAISDNDILSQVIQRSVSNYFEQIENKEQVINFVRSHLKNNRNATRKKAESFLIKYGS